MNDGPQAQGNPSGWQGVRWDGARDSAGAVPGTTQAPDNGTLARFLGGSPFSVFMRLLVMSLVVGALLIWLDIHPYMIFHALERFVQRIWYMGFDAIREIASYIIAGAVIVVPIWFLLRLMNMRGR